jgi:hypothetical protein
MKSGFQIRTTPKIRRVQTGARVTGHRAVVRINDGFKQAHKL